MYVCAHPSADANLLVNHCTILARHEFHLRLMTCKKWNGAGFNICRMKEAELRKEAGGKSNDFDLSFCKIEATAS